LIWRLGWCSRACMTCMVHIRSGHTLMRASYDRPDGPCAGCIITQRLGKRALSYRSDSQRHVSPACRVHERRGPEGRPCRCLCVTHAHAHTHPHTHTHIAVSEGCKLLQGRAEGLRRTYRTQHSCDPACRSQGSGPGVGQECTMHACIRLPLRRPRMQRSQHTTIA
jgi:hypothetical protein